MFVLIIVTLWFIVTIVCSIALSIATWQQLKRVQRRIAQAERVIAEYKR